MYFYLTRILKGNKNNPVFRQLLQAIAPENLQYSIESIKESTINFKTDNDSKLSIDTNLNSDNAIRIFSRTTNGQNRTCYSCSVLSSIGQTNNTKYSCIEIIRDDTHTLFSTFTMDFLDNTMKPTNVKVYNTIIDNNILRDFNKIVQSLLNRHTTLDFANNINYTNQLLTEKNSYYFKNNCSSNERLIGVDYRTADIGGVLLLQSPNGIWTLLESQQELTAEYKNYFAKLKQESASEKTKILNAIGKEIDTEIQKATGKNIIYDSEFIQRLEQEGISYNVFDTIAFLEKNTQRKISRVI